MLINYTPLLLIVYIVQQSDCQFKERPPASVTDFCARNLSSFGLPRQSRLRPLDYLIICSFPKEMEECLRAIKVERKNMYKMNIWENHFPDIEDHVRAIYAYCIDVYPKYSANMDHIDETSLYTCERKIDFTFCSENADSVDLEELEDAVAINDESKIKEYSCRLQYFMTRCRSEKYRLCNQADLSPFFQLQFAILGPHCLKANNVHQNDVWLSQICSLNHSITGHLSDFWLLATCVWLWRLYILNIF